MAHSLTFTSGETFVSGSRITFSTLDFLTITTSISASPPLMCLSLQAHLHAPPEARQRSDAKVACHRLEELPQQAHQCHQEEATGALPSTLVVVISHHPVSVLDLLEDHSSHDSIETNSGADEAPKRACFVATPSQNDDDRGVMNPPTRKSTSASAKHASSFTSTLRQ
jgi:hypothetical protein